ncbi:MAG: CAP domain-containing protein, partial [Actinomycetia bacterium]|nr:CAP domain-containing protein [Actinomycetes bacterium]
MPLPHRRPILRSLLILLALTAALVAVLAGPAAVRPASAAEPTVEAQLLSLTNAARAAAGAPALESSSAVVSVARRWSTAMAAQGTLSHNPDLGAQVSGWSRVAENVGVASSAEQVQQLFMGSAAHRANILDRRFDRVGIGVAEGTDGRLWFTVDLLQLAGSTAGAAPAPEPVPAPSARSSTPSPAAAARPAPRAAPRATPSEAPAPAARSQRAPAPASRSTPRSTPAAPAAPAPAAAALPDRDTAVAAAPSLARAAAPASDAGGTAATGPEDRAAIPLVLYAIPAFLGL